MNDHHEDQRVIEDPPNTLDQFDSYITADWLSHQWQSCRHEYQKCVHIYGALPTVAQLQSSHNNLSNRIRTYWGNHARFRLAHKLPLDLPANTPVRPPNLEVPSSPSPTQADVDAIIQLRQSLRRYYRWITKTQGKELVSTELLKIAPQPFQAQIRTLWGSWDYFREQCRHIPLSSLTRTDETMPDIYSVHAQKHTTAVRPTKQTHGFHAFRELPINPFSRQSNDPLPKAQAKKKPAASEEYFFEFCTHGMPQTPTEQDIQTLYAAALKLGKGTRGSSQYIPVHRLIRRITTEKHTAEAVTKLLLQWPTTKEGTSWVTKLLKSTAYLQAWPFLPEPIRNASIQHMLDEPWNYGNYTVQQPHFDAGDGFLSWHGLQGVAAIVHLNPKEYVTQLRTLMADERSTRPDLIVALSRLHGEWKQEWNKAETLSDPRQLHMQDCSETTHDAITKHLSNPDLPSYWLQEQLNGGFIFANVSLIKAANKHLSGDELVNVWKQFAWLQNDQALAIDLPYPSDIEELLDTQAFRTPNQEQWATQFLQWTQTHNPELIAPDQIEGQPRDGEAIYRRPSRTSHSYTYTDLLYKDQEQRPDLDHESDRRFRQKTGGRNESALRAWCQFFQFDGHTRIGEEFQGQFSHALNLFLLSIKHPGTRQSRAAQIRNWKNFYSVMKDDEIYW